MCEALGSLLRRAWDPRRVAAQSPAHMLWRLLLAQAHVQCVGSKYDEAVITQTMQVLAPRMASRHTQRRAVPARVQVHLREASTRDAVVAAWPLADKASLADFGVDAPQSVAQWVREAARASKPFQLPDEMASVIAVANTQGYTKALPADIAQLHGLQHGLGRSFGPNTCFVTSINLCGAPLVHASKSCQAASWKRRR